MCKRTHVMMMGAHYSCAALPPALIVAAYAGTSRSNMESLEATVGRAMAPKVLACHCAVHHAAERVRGVAQQPTRAETWPPSPGAG